MSLVFLCLGPGDGVVKVQNTSGGQGLNLLDRPEPFPSERVLIQVSS